MQTTDLMKQWAEANQNMMESIKQLGEINTSVMTKLTEHQMGLINSYMEGMSQQLESMKDANNVQDVISSQAKLAQEFSEKMLENTRQSMDVLMQTRTELTSWLEKGVEQGMESMNKAVNK